MRGSGTVKGVIGGVKANLEKKAIYEIKEIEGP
jgi:hypothetical protein